MKDLSILNKIIYFFNSITATLLLLGYSLVYIPPSTFPYISILGLFVPFLIILQILFFVFWLVQFKKQILMPSITLLIGWFISTSPFAFNSKVDEKTNSLKVMSYNVRLFNLYEWITDKNIPNKIEKVILDLNPDILAIQEYVENDSITLNYPYQFVKIKEEKNHFGMSIFSKLPIINSGSLNLKNTANNIIFADILYKKDTIRVYNIHLQSLQIRPDKENFGEENSTKLLTNVHQKFLKQEEQTQILIDHIQNWKGKILVLGDFNNNAYSYVYNQIVKGKKDAFLETGNGIGKSFNYFFPVRIDFILTNAEASISNFETHQLNLSDHYPITTNISW